MWLKKILIRGPIRLNVFSGKRYIPKSKRKKIFNSNDIKLWEDIVYSLQKAGRDPHPELQWTRRAQSLSSWSLLLGGHQGTKEEARHTWWLRGVHERRPDRPDWEGAALQGRVLKAEGVSLGANHGPVWLLSRAGRLVWAGGGVGCVTKGLIQSESNWQLFVQPFSHIQLFSTPWTAAHQASLSFTISLSLLKLMSNESVMPSNHLIVCCPLLLPSVFSSIRIFSDQSALWIRWPQYWSFSFSISPSNEYSGLISFQINWFELLAFHRTLKSLLQHHSSKVSILWGSAFFTVQLPYLHMTIGKTIALTKQTFAGKGMSLLFKMLCSFNMRRNRWLFLLTLSSWATARVLLSGVIQAHRMRGSSVQMQNVILFFFKFIL